MGEIRQAFAYLRTSSAANVAGDSSERQRVAIQEWAAINSVDVVGEYYDAAVSGADPIDRRAGFIDLLSHLNGCRTILVENASRFARDLVVQETGYSYLRERGIDLVAVDHPDQFLDESPTAVAIRQMLGVMAQLEKASLVAKLKGARERRSKELGHSCQHPNARHLDANLVLAAQMVRGSLRDKARLLAQQGYVTRSGKPFSPSMVKKLIAG